jgi:hypothetical protein
MGIRIAKHERRKTRQVEAKKRQEARTQRSDKEQIALIATRPGKSLRELTRLRKTS